MRKSTPSGSNPWNDLSRCIPEVVGNTTYVRRLGVNDPVFANPYDWKDRKSLHPHPDRRLTLENELRKLFLFHASDVPAHGHQHEEGNDIQVIQENLEMLQLEQGEQVQGVSEDQGNRQQRRESHGGSVKFEDERQGGSKVSSPHGGSRLGSPHGGSRLGSPHGGSRLGSPLLGGGGGGGGGVGGSQQSGGSSRVGSPTGGRRRSKSIRRGAATRLVNPEDVFDGVVKVMTFQGMIELLSDCDLLGGDGSRAVPRFEDGGHRLTCQQIAMALVKALGWGQILGDNFALYAADDIGKPSPDLFDTRLTWSKFRDALVPLMGAGVYDSPPNNWQGDPARFDKASVFSRNTLLAHGQRKMPDIPLKYFHQTDVQNALFKRRFVLQALFSHYAGLQKYLHDLAVDPEAAAASLTDGASRNGIAWGPGNGRLRMSELEFLALWDNFGLTDASSSLPTRKVRLTKEVLSHVFHSAKAGLDGDRTTPLITYLEFLDCILRVSLILHPPEDVASSGIADTPVSIFHTDGNARHWPGAGDLHRQHPVGR